MYLTIYETCLFSDEFLLLLILKSNLENSLLENLITLADQGSDW